MMDRTYPLPVIKQAKPLGISRGSVYARSKLVSEGDHALMTRMDRFHVDMPFAGARMLRDLSRQESCVVGRKHVATLIRCMGLEALQQKRWTTHRHPAHTLYPQILRNLTIRRTNHV